MQSYTVAAAVFANLKFSMAQNEYCAVGLASGSGDYAVPAGNATSLPPVVPAAALTQINLTAFEFFTLRATRRMLARNDNFR